MIVKKIYYIRHGKCEPEKCGSACCKALHSENDQEFFEPKDGVCQFLKNGKCSIYKYRPQCCLNFPNDPSHPIYKQVESVCSHWFERIEEEINE